MAVQKKRGESKGGPNRFRVEMPKRPLTPRQCRSWLRRTVAGNFPAIVQEFLEEMPSESCAHLKLVLELLEETADGRRRKQGTLEGLMKKLRQQHPR